MKIPNIRKKTLRLLFDLKVIVTKKKAARAEDVIFLDFKDLKNYEFTRKNSRVKMALIGRRMFNVSKSKHLAWLVEGDDFFCTFEYGMKGIMIKHYSKHLHSIEDALIGIIGINNEVWVNSAFSTEMRFDEIVSLADYLKIIFNHNHYEYNRIDCRDFVQVFGSYLDPTFDPATIDYKEKNQNPLVKLLKSKPSKFEKKVTIERSKSFDPDSPTVQSISSASSICLSRMSIDEL